jgi:HTH-type transcriptional regulator/antitoxin HigA
MRGGLLMTKRKKHPIYELAEMGFDFEVLGTQSPQKYSINDFFTHMSDKLSQIPWNELEKRGWIEGGRNISSLAPLASSFFDESTRKLFRKSKNINEVIISFWLSRIITQARIQFIDNPKLKFKKKAFNQAVLLDLAKRSVDPYFIKDIPAYLREFGVILVFERGLPGIKTDGVVMRIENGIPVIGMSLRYSRLDYFWFTLLHELSHIVLHYNLLKSPIIEDLDSEYVDALEAMANRLAQNSFVPRSIWNRCPPRYEQTAQSIKKFAKEQGIHPAIVAGMLQKETNRYDRYRSIVDSVNVINIIEETA